MDVDSLRRATIANKLSIEMKDEINQKKRIKKLARKIVTGVKEDINRAVKQGRFRAWSKSYYKYEETKALATAARFFRTKGFKTNHVSHMTTCLEVSWGN